MPNDKLMNEIKCQMIKLRNFVQNIIIIFNNYIL